MLTPDDDEFCPIGDSLHAEDNKEPDPHMHCTCWYDGNGCCRCKATGLTTEEMEELGMLD